MEKNKTAYLNVTPGIMERIKDIYGTATSFFENLEACSRSTMARAEKSGKISVNVYHKLVEELGIDQAHRILWGDQSPVADFDGEATLSVQGRIQPEVMAMLSWDGVSVPMDDAIIAIQEVPELSEKISDISERVYMLEDKEKSASSVICAMEQTVAKILDRISKLEKLLKKPFKKGKK